MTSSRITEIRAIFKEGKRGAVIEAGEDCFAELVRLKSKLPGSGGFPLHDVMAEAERRQWKPGAAENFFDHYEMVGWVYGKSRHPIRKLGAAMSTWERNSKNGSSPLPAKKTYGL